MIFRPCVGNHPIAPERMSFRFVARNHPTAVRFVARNHPSGRFASSSPPGESWGPPPYWPGKYFTEPMPTNTKMPQQTVTSAAAFLFRG